MSADTTTRRRLDALLTDRVLRDGVLPALIRVGGMVVQLVLIAALTRPTSGSLFGRLTKWDGQLYSGIARSGYPHHLTIAADGSLASGDRLAFHPLFPALGALLRLITGASPGTALITIAVLAGIASSILVHLLAVELSGSRRVGYLASGLLGALPMSVVFQLAYAESLYVALAAAVLLLAYRGQFWPAAGCAAAAGLTRPTGFVVALAIPLVAWSLHRHGGRVPRARTLLAQTAVGAAGVPAFWVFLWAWTGVWNAWFVVENHGWDSHFDAGRQTYQIIRQVLTEHTGLVAIGSVSIMLLYLVGTLAMIASRQPAPLVVVAVMSIAIALGSTNFWHSKPRLLLGAFVLVIPAAKALARLDSRFAGCLVAAGTLASAWFGAYMLDVWPFAI